MLAHGFETEQVFTSVLEHPNGAACRPISLQCIETNLEVLYTFMPQQAIEEKVAYPILGCSRLERQHRVAQHLGHEHMINIDRIER